MRVNAVAPGLVTSSGLDTDDPEDSDCLQRDLKGDISLQRMGAESKVSAAIAFPLSPAAAFIAGSWIRVDGGAPQVSRARASRRPR